MYDFMILQNHRRLPVTVSIFCVKIATLGTLKRVTGRISKLIISIEQAKILSLIFSSTEKQKIVKTISACKESTYLLLLAYKNKFISRHSFHDFLSSFLSSSWGGGGAAPVGTSVLPLPPEGQSSSPSNTAPAGIQNCSAPGTKNQHNKNIRQKHVKIWFSHLDKESLTSATDMFRFKFTKPAAQESVTLGKQNVNCIFLFKEVKLTWFSYIICSNQNNVRFSPQKSKGSKLLIDRSHYSC